MDCFLSFVKKIRSFFSRKKANAVTIVQFSSRYHIAKSTVRDRVKRKGLKPVGTCLAANGLYCSVYSFDDLVELFRDKTRHAAEGPGDTAWDGVVMTHDEAQAKIKESFLFSNELAEFTHCPRARCAKHEVCKSCLRNVFNVPKDVLVPVTRNPVRVSGDRCSFYKGLTAAMHEAHILFEPPTAEDAKISQDEFNQSFPDATEASRENA